MKPKWVLAIIFASLLIGGIIGVVTRQVAAWLGASILSFAFIFAMVFYFINKKKKVAREDEVAETMVSDEEVQFQGAVIDHRDPLNRDRMIDTFIDDFHISREKAENLFDAGYSKWSDFSEAIPEDLVMIEGINPTVARRIISTVREKEHF
ncbi:MAG: helix-hairpin-helix domain-containing protein [Thermoplasmatota archaeon]